MKHSTMQALGSFSKIQAARTLILMLGLLFSTAYCLADPPEWSWLPEQEANYAKHTVRYYNGNELDFYVIRPRALGHVRVWPGRRDEDASSYEIIQNNGKKAKELLKAAAAFIHQDAEKHGYLQGESGEAYEVELEYLKRGYWPIVLATPKGDDSTILFTLCHAIRWFEEPLPWMRRFSLHVPEIPVPITMDHSLSTTSPLYFPLRPGTLSTDDFITQMLRFRIYVFGEAMEVKFLVISDEFPESLSSLQPSHLLSPYHRLSRYYDLHRSSMRPLPSDYEQMLWRYFHHTDQGAELKHMLRGAFLGLGLQMEGGPADEMLWLMDFFTYNLMDPRYQPYFHNGKIYVHVSAPQRDGSMETARSRYFVRRLGFPETPSWNFEEHAPWGTPGIRTQIFEMGLNYYDENIEKSLAQSSGYEINDLAHIRLDVAPAPARGDTNCVQLMTREQEAIQEFLILRSLEEQGLPAGLLLPSRGSPPGEYRGIPSSVFINYPPNHKPSE
ncbi:MAG: hypothetical protein KDD39_13470 [Bdellovibrionales bacterium]|nr:hypothetical protein [Bdellovibrionales bacterium]